MVLLRQARQHARALSDRIEPTAEVQGGLDVLLLPLPPYDPQVRGNVGNHEGFAGDEFVSGKTTIQHAVEPVCLLYVVFNRMRDSLWRVLHEMIVLSYHQTKPANLPQQPFQCRFPTAQIGGEQ